MSSHKGDYCSVAAQLISSKAGAVKVGNFKTTKKDARITLSQQAGVLTQDKSSGFKRLSLQITLSKETL